MMSALYQTNTLLNFDFIVLAHAGRHVAPLGHIILKTCGSTRTHYSDSEPTSRCSYSLLLYSYRRSNKHHFIIFGLTRPGIDTAIYNIRSENAKLYTTDVVHSPQQIEVSNNICYMVVCPMERWNYENLAAKTMQEIALTVQQVFKLFTFSLFVAGIRLFHSSKLRNLNISYLYLVLEFKCLLLSFCSASLGNRRKYYSYNSYYT